MALVRTNLTAAIAIGDTSIAVASAAGIAAGYGLQIDGEWFEVMTSYVSGLILPVLRGQNGSASLAHANGALVVAGTAADFANPPAQSAASVNSPANRVREMKSYGAGGPVGNPLPGTDLFVVLTGTTVAFTLANPGKDNDGDMIIMVSGNPGATYTLTYATGFGGVAASDVVTFPAAPATGAFAAIACNERWLSLGGLVPA